MDPNLSAFLGIASRWLHILSAVTLIGGFVFAKFAVAPAISSLPSADSQRFSDTLVASFRSILYAAVGLLLATGLYNFLSKSSYPPHYHAVFGIKFLLVLHVFAISILYTLPDVPVEKRNRRVTGLVFSGVGILLLSAVLRYLSLAALAAK